MQVAEGRLVAQLGRVEYRYASSLEIGEIHDFEPFGAYNGKLVLEKVNIERVGGNEEVFVQSEPVRPLAEQRAERPALTSRVFCIAPEYRLQNAKERVHLSVS